MSASLCPTSLHAEDNAVPSAHDTTFRRADSLHEHDGRDRVPALAADVPGAHRAPPLERRELLPEPGRGHRLSIALAGDGESRAGGPGSDVGEARCRRLLRRRHRADEY